MLPMLPGVGRALIRWDESDSQLVNDISGHVETVSFEGNKVPLSSTISDHSELRDVV